MSSLAFCRGQRSQNWMYARGRQRTLPCLSLISISQRGPGIKIVQGHGKSEPNEEAFASMSWPGRGESGPDPWLLSQLPDGHHSLLIVPITASLTCQEVLVTCQWHYSMFSMESVFLSDTEYSHQVFSLRWLTKHSPKWTKLCGMWMTSLWGCSKGKTTCSSSKLVSVDIT